MIEKPMERVSRRVSQKASMVGSRTMVFQKVKVAVVKMFPTSAESLAITPGTVGQQFEMFRVIFKKLSDSSNSMFLKIQHQLLVVPLQVLAHMEIANSRNSRRQLLSFVLHVFMNLQMYTMLQMFNNMVKWFLTCAVLSAMRSLQMMQSGLCSFTPVMAPVNLKLDQYAPSLKACQVTAKCATF